jgi:lipooligosaccharide transport system ATP-binding protein
MGSKIAVEIKGASKAYEDRPVVNGISLEIYQGECFGLLGPNGAGKSTTMKLMYCAARLTGGELYVLGLNVKKNYKEIKSRIGVVPQEDGLDPDFTVLENLLIYSRYHGLDRTVAERRSSDLLQQLRLEEYADRNVETLSGGMRRRLAIARGMLNKPELLFLDEPTTGLDPQARFFVWDHIAKIKKDNGTVILTTHYMEEAESLCDRIAIIDHGRILSVGSPAQLIAENIGVEVVEFEVQQQDLAYYLSRLREAHLKYQVIRDQVSVHLQLGQESRQVMAIVSSKRITIRKPTLNDVFLKLAGHDLRDE